MNLATTVVLLFLSVPGVLLAIAVTTGTLVAASHAFGFASGLGWAAALVFGALITATDPIAVVALFKTMGAPARLRVVIEGESLVNDGTSVVLYTLAIGAATGSVLGAGDAALAFVRVVGLGVLVGVVIGFAVSTLIARIDDPLIEITLTTIGAYGSFILAEQFHVSGVLATVAAGMLCGGYGAPRGMRPSTRVAVESFWEYVAFALNSIVFLLIGFEVHIGCLLESWQAVVLAYVVVMLARAAVVFLATGLLRRTRLDATRPHSEVGESSIATSKRSPAWNRVAGRWHAHCSPTCRMARVLVAEDDTEMRRLVVEALRLDGHEVAEAADGGGLVTKLAEVFARDPSLTPVDVIVSDMRMPVCSGLELLERLTEAGWRVPFILMTAFGDPASRSRVEEAGALFLDKPLSLDDLRDAVAWFTRLRRIEAHLLGEPLKPPASR